MFYIKLARTLPVAALAVLVTASQARPQNEVTTEYYSDDTHQVLVGERILNCGGGIHRWGKVTAFTSRTEDSCGQRAGKRPPTVADHLLLHRDPLATCLARCKTKSHVPPFCPPPPEPCTDKQEECVRACTDAYSVEDSAPDGESPP